MRGGNCVGRMAPHVRVQYIDPSWASLDMYCTGQGCETLRPNEWRRSATVTFTCQPPSTCSQSYQDVHIRQTSALPHGGVLPPATSSSQSPARPVHRACGHSHPMPGCPDADPTTPVWEVQANAHVAAVAISETRRSVQRTWRLMSTPRVSLHPLGVSESCSEPVQERCGCACACAWVATSAA